jgi:hypothetical protein
MAREKEYRNLADSVRRRGWDEPNAQLRAQWEILTGSYMRLADQSKQTDDSAQSKKIDDTATYNDPIPWDRFR